MKLKTGDKVIAPVPTDTYEQKGSFGWFPIKQDRVCEVIKVYSENKTTTKGFFKRQTIVKKIDWCIVKSEDGKVNQLLQKEIIKL